MTCTCNTFLELKSWSWVHECYPKLSQKTQMCCQARLKESNKLCVNFENIVCTPTIKHRMIVVLINIQQNNWTEHKCVKQKDKPKYFLPKMNSNTLCLKKKIYAAVVRKQLLRGLQVSNADLPNTTKNILVFKISRQKLNNDCLKTLVLSLLQFFNLRYFTLLL